MDKDYKPTKQYTVTHTYVHDDPVEREKSFIECLKKAAIIMDIKHRNKEKKDNA